MNNPMQDLDPRRDQNNKFDWLALLAYMDKDVLLLSITLAFIYLLRKIN